MITRKFFVTLAALVVSGAAGVMASGYLNDTNRTASYNKGVEVVQLQWGSTGYIQNVSAYTTDPVRGHLDRVVAKAVTSTTVTDMAITVKDQNSIDLLAGRGVCASGATVNVCAGQTRGDAATLYASNCVPFTINEKLLVTVTNCGSNAVGLIYLYLSQP